MGLAVVLVVAMLLARRSVNTLQQPHSVALTELHNHTHLVLPWLLHHQHLYLIHQSYDLLSRIGMCILCCFSDIYLSKLKRTTYQKLT